MFASAILASHSYCCTVNNTAWRAVHRYELPEQQMHRALQAFYSGLPMDGTYRLLQAVQFCVDLAVSAAAPAEAGGSPGPGGPSPAIMSTSFTPEAMVLLLEVVGSHFAMGVVPEAPGDHVTSGVRLFLPQHVVRLLESSPLCTSAKRGAAESRRAHRLVADWRNHVSLQ